MKHSRWIIGITVGLVTASAIMYFIHYLIFGNFHHTAELGLEHLAFLPIKVLVVALILERLLAQREKSQMFQKLNMVVGTFFNELGTKLLADLTGSIEKHDSLRHRLAVNANWNSSQYKNALTFIENFDYKIRMDQVDIAELRTLIASKSDMLVMLLSNPNLIEHESFTDLLMAVSHLKEELVSREPYEKLPQSDLEHLAGDIVRVYSKITGQWLLYCQHLQKYYPYIFSIIIRTHPLQENPNPVIN